MPNAINPLHVSGGSSSGSAYVVATGQVEFALGTDTAGSGRVPASFNNLVGLKPTLGLLSGTGMVPACRSLDTVSIFALTAGDVQAVLGERNPQVHMLLDVEGDLHLAAGDARAALAAYREAYAARLATWGEGHPEVAASAGAAPSLAYPTLPPLPSEGGPIDGGGPTSEGAAPTAPSASPASTNA